MLGGGVRVGSEVEVVVIFGTVRECTIHRPCAECRHSQACRIK